MLPVHGYVDLYSYQCEPGLRPCSAVRISAVLDKLIDLNR